MGLGTKGFFCNNIVEVRTFWIVTTGLSFDKKWCSELLKDIELQILKKLDMILLSEILTICITFSSVLNLKTDY